VASFIEDVLIPQGTHDANQLVDDVVGDELRGLPLTEFAVFVGLDL